MAVLLHRLLTELLGVAAAVPLAVLAALAGCLLEVVLEIQTAAPEVLVAGAVAVEPIVLQAAMVL